MMRKLILLFTFAAFLTGCATPSAVVSSTSRLPFSNQEFASADSTGAKSCGTAVRPAAAELLDFSDWNTHQVTIQNTSIGIRLPKGFSLFVENDWGYADIQIDKDQNWNAAYGIEPEISKIGSIITASSTYNTTFSYKWISNSLYKQTNPETELPFSYPNQGYSPSPIFEYSKQTTLEYGTFYLFNPYIVFTGGVSADPYLITTFVDFSTGFEIWFADVYSPKNTRIKEFYEAIVSSIEIL